MNYQHNMNSQLSHNVCAKSTAIVRTYPSHKSRDEMDSNFLIRPETDAAGYLLAYPAGTGLV